MLQLSWLKPDDFPGLSGCRGQIERVHTTCKPRKVIPISYPDQYNHEGYMDMTAYLATKDLDCPKRELDEEDAFRRGYVYIADLNPSVGSEQGGRRPVLLIQNDKGNQNGPTIIVAPITSRTNKRRDLPIHYYAHRVKGLRGPCMVLLEQIRTIDKSRVIKKVGEMSDKQMTEIDNVLGTSLGLKKSFCKDAP